MTHMRGKTRDDLDEIEFHQGQNLDEDENFFFFDIELGHGNKRTAGTYQDDDLEIEFARAIYHEPELDTSKLESVLPHFECDLERLELERDKLKDRFLLAWQEGDMVSYLALETRYVEFSGFIKGLNVLKGVLRHWEEYEWGEMDIRDYYPNEDVIKPAHRKLAQKKFDTITSRAIQILSRRCGDGNDPS
jgi:hypothetical protein